MNRKNKKAFSLVLLFSGLLIAKFGASTLGSFILTEGLFKQILNTDANLGNIDLMVRVFFLIVGLLIATIGAVLYRIVNKHD